MKGLRWRIIVVAGSILLAVYLLIPSYIRFTTGERIPRSPKAGDPWYYSVLPSEVLRLGLDLSGGLHLVLGIDFDEVHQDAIAKMKTPLADLAQEKKIEGVTFEAGPNHTLVAKYADVKAWNTLEDDIYKIYPDYFDIDKSGANQMVLKLSDLYWKKVRDQAVSQSLETLRNRIDEFGIAEPILQRQGEDKILLQFPEESDPQRIKDIVARTAKLTFQIVITSPDLQAQGAPAYEQLQAWVNEYKTEKKPRLDAQNLLGKYIKDINLYLAPKLPPNTEIVFQKKTDVNTRETTYQPYLLEKEVMVTGEDLEDAYYAFDQQTSAPEVLFSLNPVGAEKFERATGKNVGRSMAIVLDGNVHSAPNIREKIGGGRAKIDMGGRDFTNDPQQATKDANDTALVLRTGALPAKLEFLEERVIGPSLGRDAIKAGSRSLVLGVALVFAFMLLHYRKSGLVACFALGLNGVFIFAFLAAFEGTLTLPGLAGITLTLGMAVDANVLIFEHMREELRAGKPVNYSISEGYDRAFSAILDGNLTTIMSALVLLSFGYGPIRGFAVTLLMGLVASMYTAVFVTRVFFDYFVISKGKTTVSV